MRRTPIRVVLADDHAVVRAGLRAVLGTARDIQVVGEAKDGREAIELAERLAPDVVVMDLTMAPMGGAEATAEIVARRLPTRVLVLTVHAEEDYLMPLLEAGAAGYLTKSAADRELVDAVRAADDVCLGAPHRPRLPEGPMPELHPDLPRHPVGAFAFVVADAASPLRRTPTAGLPRRLPYRTTRM